MTIRAISSTLLPPGKVILDPCIGCGMTSRACHALGHHCIGLELNPHRLLRTVNWLVKQGYKVVETWSKYWLIPFEERPAWIRRLQMEENGWCLFSHENPLMP